jgi:hypothetical protein
VVEATAGKTAKAAHSDKASSEAILIARLQ